jgi:glycosyltransferase involved in cell wall biosynthesis
VTKIAVIIPCLNEARTIGQVIDAFHGALPGADVYVYDNGSHDDSVSIATRSNAIVRHVPRLGKGNVLRQAFADIEADVYIIVDGDATYDATIAPKLVSELLSQQADMVTACRVRALASASPRRGHELGNKFFSRLVQVLFGSTTRDVLSGYRVFSRRFVKSFPSTARGFDIEVQITAQAAMLKVKEISIDSEYHERALNDSKLRTVRDGILIVFSLFRIYRAYSPSRFFGTFSVLSLLAALITFTSADSFEQVRYGFSLLLAASFLFFLVGVILNGVTRLQFQQSRLGFLKYAGPGNDQSQSS